MSHQRGRANRYGAGRLSRPHLISLTALAVLLALLASVALTRSKGAALRSERKRMRRAHKRARTTMPSRLATTHKSQLATHAAGVVLAACAACMLALALSIVAKHSGPSLAQTAPAATFTSTPTVTSSQPTETPEPPAGGTVQSQRKPTLVAVLALIARHRETAEHLLDVARLNATTVTLHHFDSPIPSGASEPEAASDAPDSSPYFLNAHLYNGLSFVEEGRFGKALQLDGVDDYAELASANSPLGDDSFRQLEMRDAVTVQAWVNPSADRLRRYVIMSNENASNYALSLVSTKPGDARLMFTVYATNDRDLLPNHGTAPAQGGPSYDWYWAVSSAPVPSGRWTHVAASFERGAIDGRYLKVFVNGLDVTDASYSRQPPADDYFITPGSAVSARDLPEFVWPLHDRVTSAFGPAHPSGIDIAARPLQPVVTTAPGKVLYAGDDPSFSYGLYVIIDHGGGTTSLYAHLASLGVTAGEEVTQGAIIGFAGDTGYTFGPHLHFEIRQSGRPVNPLSLLPPPGDTSYPPKPSTGPAQGSEPSADDLSTSQGFVVGARPGWWDGASWRGVGSLFKGRIDELKVSRIALQEFDLTRQPTLDDSPKVPPAPLPPPLTSPLSPQGPKHTSNEVETP